MQKNLTNLFILVTTWNFWNLFTGTVWLALVLYVHILILKFTHKWKWKNKITFWYMILWPVFALLIIHVRTFWAHWATLETTNRFSHQDPEGKSIKQRTSYQISQSAVTKQVIIKFLHPSSRGRMLIDSFCRLVASWCFTTSWSVGNKTL